MSLPAGEPAMETILASVVEARPLPTRPLDGVCACALAFSTLLSSQGADAHHPRLFSLIRGNPTNLPVLQDVVNRLHKTWLASSHVVHQAYSHSPARCPGCAQVGGDCSSPGDCRALRASRVYRGKTKD